jgi:hypothetical protein
MSPPQHPTRRDFAKTAVAAAAAPLLAPLAACAANQPESTPTPTPGAPPTTGGVPPAPPGPPPPQRPPQERDPVAEELMETLRAKYRDRLTPEQWEAVREGIAGNLRAARQLRAFELPTATEPPFAFRVYRAGEEGR